VFAERVEVRGPRLATMVIVDDPLRSVHALPGVAANNDLKAEFSLRGAASTRSACMSTSSAPAA
jgi:hypothetical protein